MVSPGLCPCDERSDEPNRFACRRRHATGRERTLTTNDATPRRLALLPLPRRRAVAVARARYKPDYPIYPTPDTVASMVPGLEPDGVVLLEASIASSERERARASVARRAVAAAPCPAASEQGRARGRAGRPSSRP